MVVFKDEKWIDKCPICTTDRYFSPDMKFLVNLECYHRMCESCVDRIFGSGPALCPYQNCGKTLKKRQFKEQIFDDINIEKEVDIRRRVCKIFNKTESDFKKPGEYDLYLEKIEDMVYNLTNEIDVEKTEEELLKYEEANRGLININNDRVKQNLIKFQQKQEMEKNLREQKRKLKEESLLEQQEDELYYEKEVKRKLLDSASDVPAEKIINQLKFEFEQRTEMRKKKLDESIKALTSQLTNSDIEKDKNKKVTTPFTPYDGDKDLEFKFTLNDSYDDFATNNAKNNPAYLAGGWRVEQVYERALQQAFIGIGCFIDEKVVLSSQGIESF
ncbi:TFIIH/NER complex subunit TFB3 [Ascoidea rubescens DSM 1968]|uniref:RNA polymerase II transcription factor B subunit 3 n=1 Tax=Ascoidea rubescens DSM 1968 TaxID=1344418 RepID=A0A1D2VFU1_9ASCO|nr:RNA polymerase II transcription factor B subunit 3 [Ascoidea rubescens DSM 1968]ODV60390.1 RNA polymerase II transcription factor B subunit 3 [Ascoidea rubescens DSM 1968]